VPIPGTKRINYLEENVKSATLEISAGDWAPLDEKLKTFQAAGTRYAPDMMKLLDT
jgi:aryl-alcohol dehydrogenase-like predicted oxidoreductase